MTPAILTVTSKDTVVREQLRPQPYLVNGVALADKEAAIAVGKSSTRLHFTNPTQLHSCEPSWFLQAIRVHSRKGA
jgi:hypothetical protein